MSAFNANAAAGHIARTICWKRPKDAVILIPTVKRQVRYFETSVTRLTSKPISPKGVGKEVGPFRMAWELNIDDENRLLTNKLAFRSGTISIDDLRQLCQGGDGGLGDVFSWAEKKSRLTGKNEFSRSELSTALERVLHSRRASLPTQHPGTIRAMTINQAKNRV